LVMRPCARGAPPPPRRRTTHAVAAEVSGSPSGGPPLRRHPRADIGRRPGSAAGRHAWSRIPARMLQRRIRLRRPCIVGATSSCAPQTSQMLAPGGVQLSARQAVVLLSILAVSRCPCGAFLALRSPCHGAWRPGTMPTRNEALAMRRGRHIRESLAMTVGPSVHARP